MKFASKPFAFIAILFLCGVLIGDTYQINKFTGFLILLSLIIIAVILGFFRNIYNKVVSVLLLISISFLGIISINETRSESFSESTSSDASFVVNVSEIAEPTKEWRKAICNIELAVETCSITPLSGNVLLFLKSENIEAGDQLIVRTHLNDVENKNNPGEFDSKSFWNNKNIYKIGFATADDIRITGHIEQSRLNEWLGSIQGYLSGVLKEHLNSENLSIAQALILGDKSLLSTETRGSFSSAGAMHVLAVSGLHVGIILYLLIFILSQIPQLISKKTALITSILVIWIYAGLTGFSPSVLRASFMFSMLAIGQVSGRRVNSVNILFFTGFVLLLLNPLFIYDIGFQLSYLAMLGILLFYKQVSSIMYLKNKWIRKIWEGTAVGISAQLLTVPLTLFYFHQFPNYFIITNIGMMVLAAMVLGTGMLLFSIHWIKPIVSLVGVILGTSISVMMFFVQFVENIPGAVAKGFTLSGTHVLLLYLSALISWIYRSKSKYLIVSISGFIVIFCSIQYDRYSNLNAKEIIVFNANHLVLTVKNKNQIVCLHNFKEEKKKQLEYLVEGYNKVRPGFVKYQKLIIGDTQLVLDKDTLLFTMNGHGLRIEGIDQNIFIRTSYNNNVPQNTRIVDMPYLQSDSENLKNGAIQLDFN
jgi:competence protein ComEC